MNVQDRTELLQGPQMKSLLTTLQTYQPENQTAEIIYAHSYRKLKTELNKESTNLVAVEAILRRIADLQGVKTEAEEMAYAMREAMAFKNNNAEFKNHNKRAFANRE